MGSGVGEFGVFWRGTLDNRVLSALPKLCWDIYNLNGEVLSNCQIIFTTVLLYFYEKTC